MTSVSLLSFVVVVVVELGQKILNFSISYFLFVSLTFSVMEVMPCAVVTAPRDHCH